jgi:hypothetical protein
LTRSSRVRDYLLHCRLYHDLRRTAGRFASFTAGIARDGNWLCSVKLPGKDWPYFILARLCLAECFCSVRHWTTLLPLNWGESRARFANPLRRWANQIVRYPAACIVQSQAPYCWMQQNKAFMESAIVKVCVALCQLSICPRSRFSMVTVQKLDGERSHGMCLNA